MRAGGCWICGCREAPVIPGRAQREPGISMWLKPRKTISRFRVRCFASPRNDGLLRRQRLHLRIKIRLPRKADPRELRHGDVTALDATAVGEAAIGLDQVGIALIAAKPEAGR